VFCTTHRHILLVGLSKEMEEGEGSTFWSLFIKYKVLLRKFHCFDSLADCVCSVKNTKIQHNYSNTNARHQTGFWSLSHISILHGFPSDLFQRVFLTKIMYAFPVCHPSYTRTISDNAYDKNCRRHNDLSPIQDLSSCIGL
jgi:hypothetical protein